MYKLIELSKGPHEAEALSNILRALADSMVDYEENRGCCKVTTTKSGNILVYVQEKEGE